MTDGQGFSSAPCVAAYVDDAEQFNYNNDDRSCHDVAWTITYCLLAALTLAGSIPVFLRTDPNTGLYSNRFFNNSTSCDIQKYQLVAGMYNDSAYDPTFMRRFKAEVTIWVPTTAGISLFWSFLYIYLFCRFARTMLGVLVLGSLLLGFGLSTLCFSTGALPIAITLVVCTVLATGFFFLAVRSARTIMELLAVGALSLQKTLWLVPTALGIKLAGLVLLAYGFSAFFSAVNHGSVTRNWRAVQRFAAAEENGFCVDAASRRIPCCTFVTHSLAFAYSAAAAAFVVWSGSLVLQLKTFTAAGMMTQWYFATTPEALTYAPTSSSSVSARRTLRYCLTASFGSLAAAAALLSPLRTVRWTCQGLLRAKCVSQAAGFILRPLTSATEKFTRFTSIAAAVTGRPFLPAARAVYELLKLNFLPCYGLWWLPNTLLDVSSALLALSWAALVFVATYATNKQYKPVAWPVSFSTAAVAFFLMLYGLLFTAELQMDIIHSLYICYGMDEHRRRVTHPSIHAAICKVPGQSVRHHPVGLVYTVPDVIRSTIEDPVQSGATRMATATAEEILAATSGPPPLPLFTGIGTDKEPSPQTMSFMMNPAGRLKRRAL